MSSETDSKGKVIAFPSPHTIEPLLTKQQVARLLGLSTSWVDKAVAKRGMPSLEVGGARRFKWSAVERWIESGQRR
jgi:excisionase family DNA binding protein